MSRSPELSEILDRIKENAGADVHVAMPAKVVRFDAAKRQIDAQPLVKNGYTDEDGTRQVEQLPVVPNVPVVYPSGGGFSITWPLSTGDGVLLVFSDLDLDKWLSTGGVVDPNVEVGHGYTNAIAIPGLMDFQTAASATAPGGCIQIGSGSTYNGVAVGGTTYDLFMAALKTHTHLSVEGVPGVFTGMAIQTAALTVPATSLTVKVSS